MINNLWVDDERPMPSGYNIHAKNYDEAIKALETLEFDCVSLDHDLGDNSKSGYEVAKYIEERARLGTLKFMYCFCHSQNPVGKKNIKIALQKAEEYWDSLPNK